jgi:hypothetical protein
MVTGSIPARFASSNLMVPNDQKSIRNNSSNLAIADAEAFNLIIAFSGT